MTDPVSQRVAIVTGASRGIGRSIALALSAQRRKVILMARSLDSLQALQKEIEASGGSAEVLAVDIGDSAALTAAVEQVVESCGRLDILVNNAGITRDGLILRMSDEDFDEVIRVNLKSAFVACRTALRAMMRGRWGRIINISSVAGLVGNPGQANYAASKAGLIGLTKTMAKELGGKGITANVVAPGFIETDMTGVLPDAVKEGAKAATPLKRFGKPAEIAAAVAYFASEEASYTTGQVLAVDGGMTMC